MNRIFSVIYSATQHTYIVCSELAKRRTKVKSYSRGENHKNLFKITTLTAILLSSGYGIAETNASTLSQYDDLAQKYLDLKPQQNAQGDYQGENAFAKFPSSTAIGAASESTEINSTAVGKSAHALGGVATAIGKSSIAGIKTQKLEQIIATAQQKFDAIKTNLAEDFRRAYLKNTRYEPTQQLVEKYLAAQKQAYIDATIYNQSSRLTAEDKVANTLAFGNEAKSTENNSVAFGDLAHAAGSHALAIGKSAYASGAPSVAIGTNAIATGNNSTSIGKSATIFGDTSIAIGKDTRVGLNNYGWDTLIEGAKNYYRTDNLTSEQIADYVFDQVSNKHISFTKNPEKGTAGIVGSGIAIGAAAQSTAQNAVSIGTSSYGWANNSVAIGNIAQAGNYYGTTGQDSVAIGHAARATTDDSISLGSYSRTASKNMDKEGFGYINNEQRNSQNQTSVWKPTRGEISVGRDGTQNEDIITRRLTHLAAGYDDTDAVNVAQLKQTAGENYIHVNSGDNKQPKGDPQTNSGFMTASAGAQSAYDIAIGVNAQTEKINRQNASIAIGHGAHTKGTGAIAFGNYAKAQNDNTIAIGAFNKVSDTDPQIDINKKVGALSAHSIAIGGGMTVAGSGMAGAGFIHQDSLPTDNAIAIGNQTVASHENGLALGTNAQTYSQNSIAIGHESNVLRNTAEGAIAIGNFAHVDSAYNVTAGDLSNLPDYLPNGNFNTQKYNYCDSEHPEVMTPEMKENCMKVKAALTNAYASIAIGDHVQVFGVPNAIVIGSNESQVYQKNGIAIGPDATSGFNLSEDEMKNGVRAPIYPDGGAIALGVHARATGKVEGAGYGHPQSSEKDGQTWTPNVGELSLGSNDYTRRIKHIAAGLDDTDAVNVAQLKVVESMIGNSTGGSPSEKTYFHAHDDSQKPIPGGNSQTNQGPVGSHAGAMGTHSVAAGVNATANGNAAISLGYQVNAKNTNGIVIGQNSKSIGNQAIAIGSEVKSFNTNTIAFGNKAKAIAENGMAFGTESKSENIGAIAFGLQATAHDQHTIAIGTNATAKTQDAIAIGKDSEVGNQGQNGSVALGVGSKAGMAALPQGGFVGFNGQQANYQGGTGTWDPNKGEVSIGSDNETRRITHLAAGHNDTDAVNVAQLKKIAALVENNGSSGSGNSNFSDIYFHAHDTNQNPVQGGDPQTNHGPVGSHAGAQGVNSLAAGIQATTHGNAGIAIGYQVNAQNTNGIVIGQNASSTGEQAIAIGTGTQSTNTNAIAFGYKAQATTENSIAFGKDTRAINTGSIAFGNTSIASGEDSVALGTSARVDTQNAIAIGKDTYVGTAGQDGNLAIGSDSKAGINALPQGGFVGFNSDGSPKYEGSPIIWDPNKGELSIGSDQYTRRITHLAAGHNDTDAVNVAQLKKALEGIETDLTNKTSGGSTGGDLSNQNFGLKAEDGKSITQPLNHTITVKGADNNITTKVSGDALEISLNKALDLSHKDGDKTTYGSVDGLNNHFAPTDSKATDKPVISGQLPNGFDPAKVAHQAGTVGDILNAGWNLQGNGKAVDFVKPFDTVNFVDGEGTHVEASSDGKVSQVKVNINVDGKTISGEPVDKDGNPVVEGNGENGTKKGEWYKPGKDGKADPNAPVPNAEVHHVLVDNGTFGLTDQNGKSITQPLNHTITVKGADNNITTKVNGDALEISLNKALDLSHKDGDKTTYGSVDGLNNHFAPTDSKATDKPVISGQLPDDFDPAKVAHQAGTVGDILNAGWNLQGNGKAVDFVKPFDTVNFVDGEGTHVEASSDGKVSQVKVNINVDGKTISSEPVDKDGNPVVEGNGENGTKKGEWYKPGKDGKADPNAPVPNAEVHHVLVDNGTFGLTDQNGKSITQPLNHTITVKGADNNITTKVNGDALEISLNKALDLSHKDGDKTTYGSVDGLNNHFAPTDSKATDKPVISGQLPDDFDPAKVAHQAGTVGDILNAGWNLQGNGKAVDFVKPFDTVNFVDGEGTHVEASSDGKVSQVKVNINVDGKTISSEPVDKDGNPVVEGNGENGTKKGEWYKPGKDGKADPNAPVPNAEVHHVLVDNGTFGLTDQNGKSITQPLNHTITVKGADNNITTKVSGDALEISLNKALDLSHKDGDKTTYGSVDGLNNHFAPTDSKATDKPVISGQLPDDFDPAKVAHQAGTVGDILNAGWNLQGNGKAVDFVKPFDTVNFVDGEGTHVEASSDGKVSQVKVNINVDGKTISSEPVDKDGNPVVEGNGENGTKKGEWYKPGKDGKADPNAPVDKKDIHHVLVDNGTFGLKAEDGKSITRPLNHTITVKGADGNITTVANDNAKTLEISLNQALDLSHKDGGETTYGSVNGLDNHFTPTDSKASEGALPEKFAPGDVARQAGTVGDILNAGWNLQGNGKAVDFVKPFDTVNFVDGEGTHVEASSDGKVSQVKVNINVDGKTISSEPVDKDGNRVVEGNGENGTKKGEWYKPGKGGKADPNAPVDKKDIHHVLVDNGTFGLKAGDGHTVSQKLNTTIVVKGATDGDIVTRVEEGKGNTKALTIDLSPTAKQELADAGKHTELASSNTTTATQVTTEGKNKGKWVVEVRKEDIPLVNDNGKVVSLTDTDAANKFVDAEKLSRALGKMGFTVKSGQKDDTGKMIKSGGEVIFRAGDNMSVSRTDSTFTFETSKNPHFSSITVNGSDGKPQVIIDKNGINAGDKPITHVADGTNPHDAVNVEQLKNVIQANHAHLENGLDTFVIGSGTRYDPFRVNVETGGVRMAKGAAITLDSKTLEAFRAAEARLATASKAVSEAVKNLSANPHDEGLKSKLAESIKLLKVELDHAQDTYRASDYTKLTTVQAVGEAINHSGFNVLATATEGGKVHYSGTVTTDGKHPMMIHPSDMMRYKAGKNMEISQNNADFTFALQDNIGVNSVTVGGQDGQVKMTAGKGAENTPTLNLTDGKGTVNKPVQIKNVAAGKEGTDAVNVNQLNNVADSIKKDVKIKFQGDDGEKNEFSRGNDGVVQVIGDKKNIEVSADKDKGTLTVHLKDHLTDITSINGLNNTTVTNETGTGNRKNMAASEGQIRDVYDIAVKKTIVKGLDGVHVDESNDEGHPVYTISIDGDKVAKSANLTYKANGTNDHSVTMKSGLDFRDGHNTKARVDVDGKVYYDIDPNLTHMQSISGGDGANGAKISLSNKDNHISVNGGKVTDVAKGNIAKDSTDAVNGSQLYETNVNVEANTNAIHKGLTFGGNVGEGQHKLGSTILVVGSEKAQNESYSSDNLTTVYTKDDKGNGSIQVQMKDKPTFKGIEITDKTGKAKVKITTETGKGRAAPSVKISTHVAGGKEAPVRVQNIADGTAPTDAVNVRQVNQALGNIATRFDGIDSRISDVDKHSSAGTATASALATLPQAFSAGSSQISAATARYRGQSAIAIGYSRISDNNKWIVRFSGSTNTQKNTVGAVGIGYSW